MLLFTLYNKLNTNKCNDIINVYKNYEKYKFLLILFLYYDNFTVTQIFFCSKMASKLFIKILY